MRHLKAFFAIALTMCVIDLIWLGIWAQDIYNDALGPLRAKETVAVAAVLFYLQYVLVIQYFAVMPSHTVKQAARRGLLIGWIGYATYELTNWAVIEGWPSELILIDIAWGLVLTTTVAAVGRLAAGPPPAVDAVL
jgi:uncharacterized membrane protein